jgi:hypothetical protein
MKEFTLKLDSPPNGVHVYFPGMVVSGTVSVTNDEPEDYDAIQVSLVGEAKCRWYEAQGHATVLYSSSRTYINTPVIVWDKQANGGGLFPAGNYTYPFSLQIAGDNLPPSFIGRDELGRIVYQIEARVIKSGLLKFDHKVHSEITLANLVHTNVPHLLQPARGEVQKTICCWCCASGPIVISLSIPRSTYCIHTDAIPFEVHVENGSRRAVNITASINQVVLYVAQRRHRRCSHVLASVSSGAIATHNTTSWSPGPLPVPQTETTIDNCSIIKVSYLFKISASIPGVVFDPFVCIPVLVGNVPLQSSGVPPAPAPVGVEPPHGGMQPPVNQPVPGPSLVQPQGPPPYAPMPPQPNFNPPMQQEPDPRHATALPIGFIDPIKKI